MKKNKFSNPSLTFLATVFLLMSAVNSMAQSGQSSFGIYAGGRYHTESTVLDFLPYSDGDISTAVGIEIKDAMGKWQFLVDGMRDPGESGSTVDSVLTPQVNLLILDRNFVAGTGVLCSYIRDSSDGNGWTKFYFQMKLGFEFTLGDYFSLTTLAVYPFEKWEELGDFDTSDMEYTAGLSLWF